MIPSPTTLVPTPADILFHNWCDSLGLAVNPAVQLFTSTQSVAGRGVFAVTDLDEGELIARIPSGLVFYPENVAQCFPETAAMIKKSKVDAGIEKNDSSRFRWIHKLWRKVARRYEFYHMNPDKTWQPELTLYAIEVIEKEHPWSGWISQWKRDDPTYQLFSSNAKPYQEEAIDKIVNELNSIMPDLPKLLIKAALAIRLGRLEEERCVFGLPDDRKTSAMYALLGSRAIEFEGLFTGVIPFHDMINHSLDPNLTMEINGEWIDVFTDRKVEGGEELFLCYTEKLDKIDENSALWALVQWGIPTPASDYTTEKQLP